MSARFQSVRRNVIVKTKTLHLIALLVTVASCSTLPSGNPETQARNHFVVQSASGDGGASDTGPDDRLRLSYASPAASGEDSLTGASSAFDLIARFGNSEINVYRFKDPDSGRMAFYDAKGEKLGQYLLRNPVPDGRKTSGYGMRRHPVLKTTRMHAGVDWAAPVGTPIYAAADGIVRFAGRDGGDGQQIVIDHGFGYKTAYSHQSKFAKGIKSGVAVKQGDIIGYVGQSGLATGPHLHYEVIVNGRKVNPMHVHFIIEGQLKGRDLAKFKTDVKQAEAAS